MFTVKEKEERDGWREEGKSGKKEKKGIFRRVFGYFKELKNELKKVVWPSKKKVFNATMIVIVTVVVMSSFVVLADFAFHNLLKLLLG